MALINGRLRSLFSVSVRHSRGRLFAGLLQWHLRLPEVLAVGVGDSEHIHVRTVRRLLSKGLFIQEDKFTLK